MNFHHFMQFHIHMTIQRMPDDLFPLMASHPICAADFPSVSYLLRLVALEKVPACGLCNIPLCCKLLARSPFDMTTSEEYKALSQGSAFVGFYFSRS